MKKLKTIFIIAVIVALFVPIVTFNMESPSVSAIDNRELTEFDIHSDDKTDMVDSYVKDRVGFRTEAISAFTVLNDRLFHEMIHPTYTYGKDGYVFFKVGQEWADEEFIEEFCQYLKEIQNYCEERNVPFVYCLNPGKVSVYSEYLPKGYNYKNKVITCIVENLEKYGVNYVNNYEVLKEKSKAEQVYNKKYDAGHWNDLGAFYGINTILSKVHEYFPNVRENTLEDFEISTEIQESLPVSYFRIDEEVPVFTNKQSDMIENKTDDYAAIKLDSNHRAFSYLENKENEGLPSVLFFRGSYVIGRERFLESRFSELCAVHNYENLLDFEYYFNIVQPDCVIVETADYATTRDYFDYEKMKNKELNKLLDEEKLKSSEPLEKYEFTKKTEGELTEISIQTNDKQGGYLIYKEHVFDLMNDGSGNLNCTIDNEYNDESEMKVVLF